MTFEDLLAKSNALTLAGLLVTSALLTVPPFTYATAAGDTRDLVASRFAATVQALGDQRANGDITDLFVTANDQGRPWYLDVPHPPRFTVGELLRTTQKPC